MVPNGRKSNERKLKPLHPMIIAAGESIRGLHDCFCHVSIGND